MSAPALALTTQERISELQGKLARQNRKRAFASMEVQRLRAELETLGVPSSTKQKFASVGVCPHCRKIAGIKEFKMWKETAKAAAAGAQ